MMWPWLQAWLSLFLGLVTALALYLGATYLVAHGEPSFTRDQRAQLSEDYPGGIFISDHAYRWCGGQEWFVIDPRGNYSSMGGSCIRWKQ